MPIKFCSFRLVFNMSLKKFHTPKLFYLNCLKMLLKLLSPKDAFSSKKKSMKPPKTSSKKL